MGKARFKHKVDWEVILPVKRLNAAPPNPNPIRRFREELRLTQAEFAELWGVTHESLRYHEGQTGTRLSRPRGPALVALLRLAKENKYPLAATEIYEFYAKAKQCMTLRYIREYEAMADKLVEMGDLRP